MQQQVRLSLRCTRWLCFRLTRLICWKTWIRVRACHLMKWLSCAAPQIWLSVPLSRPPLLWARSMAAMVVTEWVNLADIGKKEKGFLLDAPVSPSELFGTSVETVVEKFREAKASSAAFKSFVLRRSRSEPEQRRGPGPSLFGDQRWAQKASVVARAPPPLAGQREVGKTWGRWSRQGVLNALVRTGVRIETSTRFPRGACETFIKPSSSPL